MFGSKIAAGTCSVLPAFFCELSDMDTSQVTAIYAGSFDPPTLGHLWMIREGARLFGTLHVAVGTNPSKKSSYSLEQRLAWLNTIVDRGISTGDLRNVKICELGNNYAVVRAQELGATHVLRGIRNAADYGYERSMRHLNYDLNPDVSTVFLMPPRLLSEVSSSVVKGLIGPKGWQDVVEKYVPVCVFRSMVDESRDSS